MLGFDASKYDLPFAKEMAQRMAWELNSENKVISADIRRILTNPTTRDLTSDERAIRSELWKLLVEFYGKDQAVLMSVTGVNKLVLHRTLRWIEGKRIKTQETRAAEIESEINLVETTYKGRKELIEAFWDAARKALQRSLDQIDEMRPLDATKTAAIFTDKALLLSGQPTSRVARTDERMMSDEELQEKAKEYDRMLSKTGVTPDLKIVGGQDATEGAG